MYNLYVYVTCMYNLSQSACKSKITWVLIQNVCVLKTVYIWSSYYCLCTQWRFLLLMFNFTFVPGQWSPGQCWLGWSSLVPSSSTKPQLLLRRIMLVSSKYHTKVLVCFHLALKQRSAARNPRICRSSTRENGEKILCIVQISAKRYLRHKPNQRFCEI